MKSTFCFLESEVFAIFIIAMLFFWQVQQRSLHGFPMTMCNSCCSQSLQKTLYHTACITSDCGSGSCTKGRVTVPDFLDIIGSMQVLWDSYVEWTLCIYTYYMVPWFSFLIINLLYSTEVLTMYFQWWYLVNKSLMLIFYFRNTFLVSDNGKSLISPLLNRDMARKQDGMLLCIILDELEDSKNHPESKGMLWMVASVAMFSGWYPIVKKMLLNYMHSVLASPMQECRSGPAHMVAFVHVIYTYCCFLLFCRPVTTSLPYVIVLTNSRSNRSQQQHVKLFPR